MFPAVIVVALAAAAVAEVPPPSALPARVIVNGQTSTAIDIPIRKVGQQIPATYAGKEIANTPGFDFYVSEHYALKSNMGDDYARMVLEMSELAYPQWVAFVGAEPPDPDKRMYLTYANTKDALQRAMTADRGRGSQFMGGITLYSNHSSYNFPSGTLKYHQRALVIHENLHMLNMVTNGTGGTEGPTYAGEQHVYDTVKRQLTVFCFDKAPLNNYTNDGLAALRKQFVPMNEAVRKLWRGGDAAATMYQQFFLVDPDRHLKWRIWRDEFYAGRVNDQTNKDVMESIHGPLEQLDEEWGRWVRSRQATFHHVDWGWEQDGNMLWAYGFPWDKNFWSQIDIQYAPNQKAEFDPLRMDYPAEPMPRIVGPVKRGVEEPSVGFVVAGVGGKAWGGFGLGLDGRTMCQVVIAQNQHLVIDGGTFGIERQEVPLTKEVKAAAARDGSRFGVTIQIKKKQLAITVRAGKPGAIEEMTSQVALDAAQRKRLLEGQMTIIGKDGYPRITPWFDDARKLPSDLAKPAPANRWRFAGLDRLETLYRAAWRLGGKAPASLLALKSEMLRAVDASPQAQAKAIEEYEERIKKIIGDVKRCGAEPATRARALADLAGVFIHVNAQQPAGGAPGVVHMLTARLEDPVSCRVTMTGEGKATAIPVEPEGEVNLVRFRPQAFTAVVPDAAAPPATQPVSPALTTTFHLRWRGETIAVTVPHPVAGPVERR